jgi:branched-chain amino acid transport system permease protein
MRLQILFNIGYTAAVILCLSSSFSIIYNSTKIFHLAHAAVITIAAYVFYFFSSRLFFSFSFSVFFALAFTAALGLLFDVLVYSKLSRNKENKEMVFMVASIGMYVVLQNILSLLFGDDAKIIQMADFMRPFKCFGVYVTIIQIFVVIVSFVVYFLVNLFLLYTSTGKSIRAVSSNYELCAIYGIEPNKIIRIAFGIGSVMAAIVGVLYSMDTNLTPTFGFNLMLYGVVAMIIGGVGSSRGLIAGSFLVAIVQHLAAYCLDTKWMDAITYIILILFLIWKPLGFSGKRLKKVEV